MEFYLVVLHSAELEDRKRDGLGEREKDITRGTEFYRGVGDRNGPVPL